MSKVICIIDDDPIYQFLIKKTIGKTGSGHEVVFFQNGKDALDYFTADFDNLPKIILLDLEMPVMDGWDFMEKIANIPTDNTSIFIVSSSISYEDRQKAKTFPKIKGYFSKPIDSDAIQQITKAL